MDRTADYFAESYAQARAKFLAAVEHGGARLLSSHTIRPSRAGALAGAGRGSPAAAWCCIGGQFTRRSRVST